MLKSSKHAIHTAQRLHGPGTFQLTCGDVMPNSAIHCPLCNATKASGLGLVVYDQTALVQYRCRHCGELFFAGDRRDDELVQLRAGHEDTQAP